MNLIIVNRLIFSITASLILATIIIYGLFLLYYGRKKIGLLSNEEYVPNVTILIPTHNEKTIIHKRIQNLFELDYPKEKISVIFIDDSNDETPEIIQGYVDENPNFKLLSFTERMGYSPSIMAGAKEATTDIIILNEAGSLPAPDSISMMVRHFQDPQIGAVSGRSVILNIEESVGQMETVYLRILNYFRDAESKIDSTFSIQGEAMAVRRNLILNIDTKQDTGSVDTSMAFEVR